MLFRTSRLASLGRSLISQSSLPQRSLSAQVPPPDAAVNKEEALLQSRDYFGVHKLFTIKYVIII